MPKVLGTKTRSRMHFTVDAETQIQAVLLFDLMIYFVG